jgi:hypothetical protein
MLGRARNVKITITVVDIQSTIRHPLLPVRLCTTALTATPMRPSYYASRLRFFLHRRSPQLPLHR